MVSIGKFGKIQNSDGPLDLNIQTRPVGGGGTGRILGDFDDFASTSEDQASERFSSPDKLQGDTGFLSQIFQKQQQKDSGYVL